MIYGVAEYKELENEMKVTLEANYQYFMLQGDLASAYETLGKMMAYKLIDTDDPRIEADNKSFKRGGIDKKHRFANDYRSNSNYMPRWLFGSTERRKSSTCKTVEHWGVRLENGYEGYVVFKSNDIKIMASLAASESVADAYVTDMCNAYKHETGKNLKDNPTRELCATGVSRIYKFEIDSHTNSSYKTVGFGVVMMSTHGPCIKIVPKYQTMILNWIDINDCIRCMENIAMNLIASNGMWSGKPEIKVVIPPTEAIKKLNDKVSSAEANITGIIADAEAKAAARAARESN